MLTVTVYEQDEGSYLDCSGTAAPGVASAVNFAVDRLLSGLAMAPSAVSMPTGLPTPFPSGPGPAFSAKRGPAPGSAETKACPECAETIRAAAKSCRFCGYRLSAEST